MRKIILAHQCMGDGPEQWELRQGDCFRNPKREEDGWPLKIIAVELEKVEEKSPGRGRRLDVRGKGEEDSQGSSLGITGLIVPINKR